MKFVPKTLTSFWSSVRKLGWRETMGEYEKRKLSVFNQLNAVGIFCGLLIPIVGLFDEQSLPAIASIVAFSPSVISSVVLLLNHRKKHEWARMVYFSFYPFLTSLVYGIGLDVGLELFFILYGVLAVFYMQKRSNGLIAFLLSITLYLIVFVFGKQYAYNLRVTSFPFYVFNHLVAIIFIFFALSWIKKENNAYQQSILEKNQALLHRYQEIESQKEIIAKKAEQLAELNTVKNKLFSIISHDLKNPLYALRNLFRNVEQYDLPGEELKAMVPDIIRDLQYTTSLMENLLQWAKSQMNADALVLQFVDLSELIQETTELLRLQATAKKVHLKTNLSVASYVVAEKDMVRLVLRNLVSNAIKFTPANGSVFVDAVEFDTVVEISISDTGVGMSNKVLHQLSQNSFYSTNGTASETGTGLGLMICKEFLSKIGSKIYIESEEGKGSTFSFILPKKMAN